MYPQFTNHDIKEMSKWEYKVVDDSMTNKFLIYLWKICIQYTPRTVAPNLLTLINLIVCLGIWIVTEYFFVSVPLIILCYVISSTLDGLDGMQARRIKNSTAFGELFDHSVDIITLFVVARITSIVYGVRDLNAILIYIVLGSIFCMVHFWAYIDGYMTLSKFTGPNEMLFLIIITYLTNPWINWGYFMEFSIINQILCMSLLFFGSMYFAYKSFVDNLNSDRYITMILYCDMLLTIVLLSNKFNISHMQIACIFIIINAEIIVAKMSNRLIYLQPIVICFTFLVGDIYATIITLYIMFNMFIKMLNGLKIPFLSVF